MTEDQTTRVWQHPPTLVSILGVVGALALIAFSAAWGQYATIGLWVLIGGAIGIVGYISWVTKDD